MLDTYFKDIFNTTKTGDATEESYYPDLKRLIENWAIEKSKKFYITPLPKRTEAGNPDFRIWDGKEKIVGYIEAKSPTTENLDNIEVSEQLKRYRHTFPNLILTNFFEFRLYRNGNPINKVLIGHPFVMHKLKMVPPPQDQDKFSELLEQFFAFSTPKPYNAKSLAIELAKRTRFLRDQVISEELKEEEQKQSGYLFGFYKAFREHLIASLTHKDFANLYAQTITYGLFAARSRAENGFNRKLAYDYIPHTIGILRDVFKFISLGELPSSMEWIVDDIAEVLAIADVNKIINDFYKEGKGRDPIIHFYETFLAEYDPKEREKRGVYYTPEPVVSYIVRSIHHLLKEKFGKVDGFATPSVTVLDPAAGTLTFITEAIRIAIEEYKNKYGDGGVKSLIKDHILKNFYAFELMMAPYAIGHLKIGFVLDEFDYKLSQDERFNLYLTNTLDFTKEDPDKLPGILEQTIAKESSDALEIKENIPIMVIMGNPPYSGSSENKGEWILSQIAEYKQIEGESLGEKNPKWIQDDYVKFFRFAQWKIENAEIGILGFITNHAWLDNPTFRGMRYSLLKTFDELYILNLHGSTLKKERTPEGDKDENIFDIRPGVAISICIRNRKVNKKVSYSEFWGAREQKNSFLDNNNVESIEWSSANPSDPYYFFIPKNKSEWGKYKNFWKITDIFPINCMGIQTHRDSFVIDLRKEILKSRLLMFFNKNCDDELIKTTFKLKETKNWKLTEKRRIEFESKYFDSCIKEILCRPFDIRFIFFHKSLIDRPRLEVMHNILINNNLLLLIPRQVNQNWQHCFITNKLAISDAISSSSREGNQSFPLYIYPDRNDENLFSSFEKNTRQANINKQLLSELNTAFIDEVNPEEILNYIYSILYSNIYRQKYEEFLKIDFPRIPFTKTYSLFQKISSLGNKLVDLHLMRSSDLNNPIAKFFGVGSNRVEGLEYLDSMSRVYINKHQYFDGIKPEVWNYHIGGYQVLNKWLKDRKGRALSSEDVKHYCRVVTALSITIVIQEKIDELYPDIEKNLIDIE
jgi:type I restriction-modification system DNA methylase subunit